MRLELLGNVRLLANGSVTTISLRRPTALLLYLAYRQEWVSRDELCFLFEPDLPDSVAKRKLRMQIYRAKNLPWANNLEIENNNLRFLVDTDVRDFEEAILANKFKTAMELYKGPLFGAANLANSLNFSTYLEHERNLLHEKWLRANLEYSKILEKENRPEAALDYLTVVMNSSSIDEKTLQKYMLLNISLNKREKALAAYHSFSEKLQKELGLLPHESTTKLALAIENNNLNTAFSIEKPAVANVNLPHSGNRFIGREKELSALSRLFGQENNRLISIIGPGGCGKTRLSIEIAKQLSPNFYDGTYFVALAATKNADLLSVSIAEQMGIQLGGSANPEEILLAFLREKHLLLLLDNFEHLLAGLEQIQNIITKCPRVHLLISSRERLKLPAEVVLDIHGLDYDNPSEQRPSPAQELFLEAAKRLGKTEFDQNELKAIQNICQRLEGMPLAIELAASWLRVLSCQEIASELANSFELLNYQQSSRSTGHSQEMLFEHSWRLLSKEEKQALAKLSIFDSSFDRHAALKICDVHLSLLLSLVDKSLLIFDNRFRFHELIRYYASKKLGVKEKSLLLKNFASYFSSLLTEHIDALHGKKQAEAMSKLQPELDNFRKFWRWSVENSAFDLIDPALNTIFDIYSLKSYFKEGVEILDRAAESVTNQNPRLYYRLLARKARFLMRLGKYKEDIDTLKSCRDYFEKNNLKDELVGVFLTLGTIYRNQGDLAKSEECYEKSISYAKEGSFRQALAINNLGIVAYRNGHVNKAKNLYEKSLNLFKSAGLSWASTLVLNNLGIISYANNELEQANRYFASNVKIFEKIGDTKGKALSISNLGTIAFEQGLYEKSISYHQKSLALALQIGEIWAIANDYANLSFSNLMLGKLKQASAFLKNSLSYSKELNSPPMTLYALLALAGLEHKQGQTQKAKDLFHFILNHPASSRSIKDRGNKLAKKLTIHLEKDKTLKYKLGDLDNVVTHYLNSL